LTADEILAHHEASNVVAALELRIPFINVTFGKVRVPPRAFDLSNQHDVERDAVFTLAGECAEARIHEDLGHTSECDRKHLEELSVDRHPDEPHLRATWKLEMEGTADLVVQKHWEMIERLATYLLVKQVASRAQVIEHLQWPTSHNVQWLVFDQ
jgi:hypothetical protein